MPNVPTRRATYSASPNIALVKYWGVRDVARALPYNSSISVTLDRLRTRTTVEFDPALPEDVFVLNGKPAPPKALGSVSALLDRVRIEAKLQERARVTSSNNFPTASGLASSASGFAALAGAGAAAAGGELSEREVSQLARFGSGSACRSVFSGFVEWRAGTRADGRDCYARPLHDEHYWPELVDLVLLLADAPEKEVRSAVAMQSTVSTSPEFRRRQRELPRRTARIRRAIARREAEKLFPLLIEECDDFRLVCETTRPPLDYLTRTSRSVLDEVHSINGEAGRPVAGYTHDAGAHVHVFLLASDAGAVRRRLRKIPGVRETLLLHPGPGGRLETRG
ncbi:MAG: diphosphomevalonate decarboxylase [Thermoplasmata archaeon]|nr:diphosphomevalonate decarboxylase [Thermoplasmata archaeon]